MSPPQSRVWSSAGAVAAVVIVVAAATHAPVVDAGSCPFFGGRNSQSQFYDAGGVSKLSNCTWYDRDSCCTDSEVTAIMDSQEAIPGASEACIDAFNMLMCWPCDPAQSGYYVDGALTLCLDFCERVYDGCDSFNEAYETAQAFCEAKGYRVQEETGAGCFNAAAALAPAWALLVAASAAVVSLRAPLGRR